MRGRRAHRPEVASQPSQQDAPRPKTRKWILIADDDKNIRSLLARVLSEAGYAVVTARDGVEALELAAQLLPHLIILDLRMPRMSGVEFLTHARSVPIVVMSGLLGDLPADGSTSVVARLQKPVSLDVLRSTVRDAVAS